MATLGLGDKKSFRKNPENTIINLNNLMLILSRAHFYIPISQNQNDWKNKRLFQFFRVKPHFLGLIFISYDKRKEHVQILSIYFRFLS